MKLLITFLLTSVALFAHPHIFVDIYPKINIQNNKATSLSLQWKFDQMTSSMLIMKYDRDKDNQLNKKELSRIKKNAIKSLKKNNYYLKIVPKNENAKIQKLDNFVVTINKMGRLIYSFDLICSFEVKESNLLFYHKNYYIAFMLKKSSVEPLNKNLNFSIRKVDNERYFGYAMQIKDIK
ncbi:MAG: DUF1007 family protein [Sulfurimonas sp.]|nr:DUF1007 family protein [Sulfurimonas sp.]